MAQCLDKPEGRGRVIAKQPNGKYQTRIFWKGKQVAMATFPQKATAKSWEAAQYEALTRGTWVNPKLGNIALGTVIAEFNAARLGAISRHSWDTDESNLRNHVPDSLKRKPIRAVSQHDLEKVLLIHLRKASRQTTKRFRDSLVSLWKFAKRAGYVATNIALEAEIAAGEGEIITPVRPFFRQDLVDVIATVAALNPGYADLIEFLAHTGVRWGEVRALKVSDLVQVPLIAIEISRSHSDGYSLKSTKSGKSRLVPLDDRAQELAQKHSAGKTQEEYLFRSPRGRQLSSANFKRAVKWEVLTDRRVHDLRHTAATNWISAGLDVKTVSVWLGHSTSAITHRVYAGWLGIDANIAALMRLRRHQETPNAIVTEIPSAAD
jgi:integrase